MKLYQLTLVVLAGLAGFVACTSPVEDEIITNRTDMQALLSSSTEKTNLVWSPDSSMLAYEVPVDTSNRSIFVYNLLDKSTRDLLPDAHDKQNRYPTFTPDSRHVIFSQNNRLMRLYLDTGELTPLTPLDSPEQRHPDVSPDGSVVVFDDGQNIYTLPVEGGTPHLISQSVNASLQKPTWSPTGEQVACLGNNEPATTLYIFNLNNELDLAKEYKGYFNDITWAPVQTALFGSPILIQNGGHISTLNPKTGKAFDAFEFGYDVFSACWAPNGSDIGFSTPYQVFRTPLFTVLN